MLDRLLADLVAVAHLGFVLFVLLGGFLVLRWPRAAWFHLPAAAWGVWVELAGWVCPLTPLENWLRGRAGEAAYAGGFVEHFLLPLLYPAALTRATQIALGAAAGAVNIAVYAWLLTRPRGCWKRSSRRRCARGG